MHFSILDLVTLTAELEQSFRYFYHVSIYEAEERPILPILEHFASAADQNLELYSYDFGDVKTASEAFAQGKPRNISTQSHLLNYGSDARRATILINEPTVNYCWNRFCLAKEAAHATLRRNMNGIGADEYPDTKTARQGADLLSDIVRLKYSLNDFDKIEYPPHIHAENAAELLAIFILYPPHKMMIDREKLYIENGVENGTEEEKQNALRTTDFRSTADRHKVPLRYVELFMQWKDLDQFERHFERKIKDC